MIVLDITSAPGVPECSQVSVFDGSIQTQITFLIAALRSIPADSTLARSETALFFFFGCDQYQNTMSTSSKRDMKQKPISSFFGGLQPKKSIAVSKSTVTSSRRENISSVITKTLSQGAFDELPSSEISFGSPEINNFKNSKISNTILVDLTDDNGFNNGPDLNSSPLKRPKMSSQDSNSVKRPAPDALFGNLKLKRTLSSVVPQGPQQSQSSLIGFTSQYTLSNEQKFVIDCVVNQGLNVFYTGSAGTGKSIVLHELKNQLYYKFGNRRVAITASTGLAACNIGGQTLHRYLGIGLGQGLAEQIANKVRKNASTLTRWKSLKVLIIDEISMVDGILFSKLNDVARLLRNNAAPFGGIQLVCTGDFFQLPPVSQSAPFYCFQAKCWPQVIQKTILLTNVFRQKGDNQLIDMLNALRHGELDPETIANFYKLSRRVNYTDGLEPTELYPTREEVKRANNVRLSQLQTRSITFTAQDSTNDPNKLKMLENLMCEKALELKEGAQVMFIKNVQDLVNGSIGNVVCFSTPKLWEATENGYRYDRLDVLEPQIVAELRLLSSRVGRPEVQWGPDEMQLYNLIPYDRKSMFANLLTLACKEFESDLLPVVKFKLGDRNEIVKLIPKEEFIIDIVPNALSPSNQITRTQLPLLLSWAMSIHKAQGQTIDRLRIDLKKVFEKGQVYVALSRAINKEHLEILNFDPHRIKTSQEVKQFYKGLEQVQH